MLHFELLLTPEPWEITALSEPPRARSPPQAAAARAAVQSGKPPDGIRGTADSVEVAAAAMVQRKAPASGRAGRRDVASMAPAVAVARTPAAALEEERRLGLRDRLSGCIAAWIAGGSGRVKMPRQRAHWAMPEEGFGRVG